MIKKRFTYDSKTVSILKDGEFWLDGQIDTACNHSEICNELNALNDENEQLKKENNKLHQKIFEMRTNIALERTEISRQTYTGKKNEKEYLDAKEFLDEMEKW